MKGLAIIYKKSTIKRDNGNDICIYTAVALKSGKLEKGEFIDSDNKKYSFINNQKDDEEFVYAFPYFTDIENEKLDLLIEKIENIHNDFDDYTLFQTYDEEGNLVLLASNDNLNTHIEIDASIFGNYLSMLEYEACEDEFEDAEKNNIEIIKKNIYLITDECYKSINESIINQDEQIKKILSIMAKNLFISNVYLNTDIEDKDSLIKLKQNLLLCGPTNTGKTETIKLLSKYCDIPYIVADAPKYSSLYLEDYIKTVIKDLLIKVDFDIAKAQRGIILFEKFDENFINYPSPIQIELLNAMKGIDVEFEITDDDSYNFNTSTLTFIFTGKFSSIEDCDKKIGFCNSKIERNSYSYQNLVNYGITEEFLNSVNIIRFNPIDLKTMKTILLESKISPLVLNQKLYELLNILLICPDETANLISEKALSYNIGAKGIEKVLVPLLNNIEYDIYSSSENYPSEIIITEESIEDSNKLILKR